MVSIEGTEFTLFADYDRESLKELSEEGKIEWFEKRVRYILINPLKKMLENRHQWEKDKSCHIMLCFTTLICCGIEALSSFYEGKEASGKTFRRFVEAYMDPSYKTNHYYKFLRDSLRNGLAHCFCIKKGGIEDASQYFTQKGHELWIDPICLFEDFEKAFERYINDIKSGGPRIKFVRRFDQVFI